MANKATQTELEAHLTMKDDPELSGEQTADILNFEKVSEAPSRPAEQDTERGADAAPGEPPKRKRGRPSNAEKALNEELGKENVNRESSSSKPGPKPGKKGGDKKTLDVTSLGNQLVGIHQIVAMFTGIQEAQISEQEGHMLAKGIVAVCDEYDLSVDGKTGAAIQLFAAAAMVYAPRALSFKMRTEAARAQAAREVNPGPAPAYTYDPSQAV